MSTHYIISRVQQLSRAQLLANPNFSLFVSESDEKLNLTIDDAEDIGIDTGSGTIWATLVDDVVVSLNTYCDSYNGNAPDAFESAIGIKLISEHDNDFAKEQFPVDVTVTPPTLVIGKWQLFLHEGWYYPYHSGDKSYFYHLSQPAEDVDSDIDKYVAELHSNFDGN